MLEECLTAIHILRNTLCFIISAICAQPEGALQTWDILFCEIIFSSDDYFILFFRHSMYWWGHIVTLIIVIAPLPVTKKHQ